MAKSKTKAGKKQQKAANRDNARGKVRVEKRSERLGEDVSLVECRHFTPRGLQNLGNTCYFNAALQGIVSVPHIRSAFLGKVPLDHTVCKSLQEFVEASYDAVTSCSAFSMSPEARFAPAHNPQRLLSCVSSEYSQFKGRYQQDSQELLTALLSMLADADSAAPAREGDSAAQQAAERQETGVGLRGLFEGELLSTVSCVQCGHSSTHSEAFTTLSLAIPANTARCKAPATDVAPVEAVPAPRVQGGTAKSPKVKSQQSKQAQKKNIKAARQAKHLAGVVDGALLGGSSAADDAEDERAPASPPSATNGCHQQFEPGVVTVAGCLSAFFRRDTVQWTCDNSRVHTQAAQECDLKPAAPSAAVEADTASQLESHASDDFGSALSVLSAEGSMELESVDACLGGEGPGGKDGDAEARGGLARQRTRSRRTALRRVSFSDSHNSVKLIPGSAEQRGTDFRAAMRGHVPFRRYALPQHAELTTMMMELQAVPGMGAGTCARDAGRTSAGRPLAYQGASLLVTADVGSILRDRMFVRLQPYDDDDVTQRVLRSSLRLATVHMEPISMSGDEEEQADVSARAQVLMDCMADMVEHHGLDGSTGEVVMHIKHCICPLHQGAGLKAMTAQGVRLARCTESRGWTVHGPGSFRYGGSWEYPHVPVLPPAEEPVLDTLLSSDLGRASSFGSFGSLGPLGRAADGDEADEQEATLEEGHEVPGGSCNLHGTGTVRVQGFQAVPLPPPEGLNGSTHPPGGLSLLGIPQAAVAALAVCEGGSPPSLAAAPCSQDTRLLGGGLEEPAQAKLPGGCVLQEVPLSPVQSPREHLACADGTDVQPTIFAEAALEAFHTDYVSPAAGRSDAAMGRTAGGAEVEDERVGAIEQSESAVPLQASTSSDSYQTAQSTSSPSMTLQQEPCCTASQEVQSSGAGSAPVAIPAVQQHQPAVVQRAPQQATKQYLLNRLPETLCLHLKRFTQAVSGQGKNMTVQLLKLDTIVPVDWELDVADYCSKKVRGSTRYELVAVVEHSGTLKSGHYVAYVRRGGESIQLHDDNMAMHNDGTLPPVTYTSTKADDANLASDSEPQPAAHSEDGPVVVCHTNGVGEELQSHQVCFSTDDESGLSSAEAPQPSQGKHMVVEQPDAQGARDASDRHASAPGGKQNLTPAASTGQQPPYRWYYVSDTHVKEVPLSRVRQCQAYVLFYSRL